MKRSKLKKYLSLLSATAMMMSLFQMPLPTAAVGASDAEGILKGIQNKAPSISEDGSRLILPAISSSDYEVTLYGSSNEAVVDLDGRVYTPLTDMTVTVMYQVTNKSDPEDTAVNQYEEATIVIPGQYKTETGDNEKPDVLPQIREWKGARGGFILSSESRLVIGDESLRETAEVIAYYFGEMLDRDITIASGEPKTGDIFLSLTEQSELGDEGYTVEIGDTVTVGAPTAKGVLYAGTTLTQILYQDDAHERLPKGLIRDYPQYEVRSCMMDVARVYIPLDYLEEMTKYMAYFKLNEIHVHINDNGGEQDYAFRLESQKYPEINANLPAGEIYSQEDYKRYQIEMKKYGIDVVTEIDTPAHSGFVNLYDKSLMLDASHVDVRKEATLTFVKSLLDEYLDGEDPVIQSEKFHIGTDEYPAELANAARAYMNELIEYVNAKGYETRMWGSLGGPLGLSGHTEVSTDAVAHYWSSAYSDFTEMIDAGYPCINNWGLLLYIVPGLINDHLNIGSIYETWEINELEGGVTLAKSSPLMMGAEASLWHDIKVGSSEYDIFDRFRDQIVLMAEKNWYGDRDADETGEEFLARVAKVDQYAPGSNPAEYVESQTDVIASYDFENVRDKVVPDGSGNIYNAQLNGLTVVTEGEDHVLKLDGQSALRLPFDAVGFPYTVSFDLFLDGSQKENAVLFSGDSGTMYLNYKGTGCLGYERKGYTYIIPCALETDRWQTVMLTCDDASLKLYIDGVYAATGTYDEVEAARENSSTFVLTTAEIGSEVVGMLDDLKIRNICADYEDTMGLDLLDYKNLALNKDVTVSGLEVQDGRFTGEMAVDGDLSTRVSFEQKDDAWMIVDLGAVYLVDAIEIEWNEQADQYAFLVSEDGEHWTQVKENLNGQSGAALTETITLPQKQSVRYVKYQQMKMWQSGAHRYSGNFKELCVYGYGADVTALLAETKNTLETVAVTEENKVLLNRLTGLIDLTESFVMDQGAEELAIVYGGITELLDRLETGDTVRDVNTSPLDPLMQRIDETPYKAAEIAEYVHAYRRALVVLADPMAEQRAINEAAQRIQRAVAKLGPANLALGKPVTSATGEPSVITDGSLDNFWDGGNYPADFVIDLGGEYAVSKFVAYPFVGQGRGYRYEIYVSTDGENYTPVAEKKKPTEEIRQGTTFELDMPVTARYVKVVMTYNNVNTAVHMREFEVYSAVTTVEDVNTEALEAAVAHAEALDLSTYTEASVGVLREALEAAKNGDYTTQESVDTLTGALEDAIAGLVSLDIGTETDVDTSESTPEETDPDTQKPADTLPEQTSDTSNGSGGGIGHILWPILGVLAASAVAVSVVVVVMKKKHQK